MSLNAGKAEYHYFHPKGMDSTSNPLLLQDGAVVEAWNADIFEDTYKKRTGFTEVVSNANVWTGKSVTQAIEYFTLAGATKDVVFGTDGTNAGGVLALFNSGTFTSLQTGLDESARPFLIQIAKQLLFVNGVDDPLLYDGTNVKQYGITAPTALTATTSTSAGLKVSSAQYLVAITYYNSVTGAESSPFIANPVVMGASDKRINLSFSAANSATADKIRIYTSFASSNVLLLEDEIIGASTSYSCIKADYELTLPQLELDNSRVTDFSSSVEFPAIVANRVFLKTANNEIRHSKIGQSGPMLESFEATALCSTQSRYGAGDDIVGIGSAGDVPIIVKQRSVGRLDAVGVPDNSSSLDNVRYVYTELSDNIGGIYHGAGTQVYGEYVFLSRSGVYATDGKTVRPVGEPIRTLIQRAGFSPTQTPKISAVNDETNKRVLISLFESSSAVYADFVLVGDYKQYPDFCWTIYRPGISRVTHPGIRVGCFYSKRTNLGTYSYYFGNSELNGQIYQLYSGNSDNVSAIYFKIKTKAYSFGDPAVEKLVKTCTLHAQGSGRPYTMQVSSIFDLGGIEEESQDVSLDGAGSTWDNVLWDRSFWGGRQQTLLSYEPHNKCRFIQLVFKQIDEEAPLTIYSWDLSASVFRLY